MVDGLVQHKAKDTHAVGHGHTHIPLLLEQLIQPHPLKKTKDTNISNVAIKMTAGIKTNISM